MEISIESASEKFSEHLKQPQNNRILFSGKFGTGKSYFLKKYFEQRDEEYNLFWLSPVNYVVGANQDIFEWIKIDIAKELLKKKSFAKDSEKYSTNFLIQAYLYNNASTVFTDLMTTIGDAIIKAKTGFSFLKDFQKHIKEYNKYVKTLKSESRSELEKIEDYLADAFQIKGSIYEDDLTTQTLRASVEYLKYKEGTNKKNILVIDDLDRLDPEHIFRILNILSVHNDHFDSNKFGFDKVILVCDLKNIEHIYRHKYGEHTDFIGYIDKFYTYEPFYFTIYDAIIRYCNSEYAQENIDYENRMTMVYVLHYFYKAKMLRIRNLKKISSNIDLLINRSFKTDTFIDKEEMERISEYKINYNNYDLVKVIWLLSIAFGNTNNFIQAIDTLAKKISLGHPISKDYVNNIRNSIGILYHIATSNDTVNGLFYNRELVANDVFKIKHIQKIILGYNCLIFPYWSNNNKYNGGDFFKNSIIKFAEPIDNLSQDFTFDLFQSLKSITIYLVKRGVLHNIDMD